MQSVCLEDERGLEGAKTELVPLPGGSLGARKGPREKFCKSEGPTKMATDSIDSIFTVPRGHIVEGRNALKNKKAFKLITFFSPKNRFQNPDGSTARVPSF